MKKLIIVILCIMVLGINISYSANSAYFELNAKGIDQKYIESIDALFKSEIENNGYKIVADRKSANIVFVADVVMLSSKIIVTLKKVDASSGKVIFSQKATTEKIDEIDVLINRLVVSVVKQEDFQKTATVKNVTSSEAKENVKMRSEFLMLFGFPLTYVTGIKNAEPGYGIEMGIMYEIENFRVNLEWMGSLAMNDGKFDKNMGVFTIGYISLSYLFLESNISPFVELGFGYGYAVNGQIITVENQYMSDDIPSYENRGGYIPCYVGAEFFRLYDFRLIVKAGANFPVQSWKFDGMKIDGYKVPLYFSLTFAYTFTEDIGRGCCWLLF